MLRFEKGYYHVVFKYHCEFKKASLTQYRHQKNKYISYLVLVPIWITYSAEWFLDIALLQQESIVVADDQPVKVR